MTIAIPSKITDKNGNLRIMLILMTPRAILKIASKTLSTVSPPDIKYCGFPVFSQYNICPPIRRRAVPIPKTNNMIFHLLEVGDEVRDIDSVSNMFYVV
jgi:hypothetical protein